MTVTVTVDLEAPRPVTRAMHHACGAPGYKPDSLQVETSVDGKAWTPQGRATAHRGEFLVVDFAPVAARYVRFRFAKTRHHATDDWLFLDELEVF